MTSSTTVRKSTANHKGANHKGSANQRAGTVQKESEQKASEQQETTPGQRGTAEREASGGFAFGIKMPGGTKGNLLWWGSLAALAAFEVVDWPVAALVAAGTWIAEQHTKQKQQKQLIRAEAAA
jgi:hypothetical protein